MIELLSRNVDKIKDAKVRETFIVLLHEYERLNLAVRIFSRIIEDINAGRITVDMEHIEEEAAKRISMKIMI